jgi:hypothetical protein
LFSPFFVSDAAKKMERRAEKAIDDRNIRRRDFAVQSSSANQSCFFGSPWSAFYFLLSRRAESFYFWAAQ